MVHSRWTGKWFCFDVDTSCARAKAKRDRELGESFLAAEVGLVDRHGKLVGRRSS